MSQLRASIVCLSLCCLKRSDSIDIYPSFLLRVRIPHSIIVQASERRQRGRERKSERVGLSFILLLQTKHTLALDIIYSVSVKLLNSNIFASCLFLPFILLLFWRHLYSVAFELSFSIMFIINHHFHFHFHNVVCSVV